MNVLGLSAFYHESACCLLQDGRLLAAAAEERFTRRKHDPGLPVEAFRFCLQAGGLSLTDLDAIAYYERPVEKLARQLWSGVPAGSDLAWLDPGRPERAIRERLGWDGPLLTFDHHLSHAASAYYYSGFDEAAILTVDGVGEWDTTTYGRAAAGAIDLFASVRFPHSLGLLYSTLTSYLGFRVNGGEYKVMGLAPYGESRLADRVRALVTPGPGGSYRLDLRFFDFIRGQQMYSPSLCDLFGAPPRPPGGEITPFHRDLARSLQLVLEEMLLEKTRWLHAETQVANLCMAGGVALNCVANGRFLREGPFERLFVPPAAGDAGGCLGAAALAHAQLTGQLTDQPPAGGPLRHAFYGPRWSADEIAVLLTDTGLPARDYRRRESELLAAVVDRLEAGKVVGWFHGPMEIGPRALGARSLLADPRDPGMRDRLNRLVKKREGFRPFAPSVLASRAAEHFDLDHPSPFMLETCRVISPLALPAVTHVDGSARPQTVDPGTAPRFAALLAAFEGRTGCPILLNTSFNLGGEPGEPIVCTPADALFCLGESGIDALVLEDHLLDRADLPQIGPEDWADLLAAWRPDPGNPFERPASPLGGDLYTFV